MIKVRGVLDCIVNVKNRMARKYLMILKTVKNRRILGKYRNIQMIQSNLIKGTIIFYSNSNFSFIPNYYS